MDKPKNLENKSGLMVGGGVIAAITASLCCVGPLILTLLGVSGAAALSKMEFLRIPMTLVVLLLFGIAGHSLFKKKDVCKPGSICADPKKYKRMVIMYWVGFVVAILGITSPNWIVWIFG